MSKEPDFFLTCAGELIPEADLSAVRACWNIGRVRNDVCYNYMLVEVQPPVIGQKYGLGCEDITKLILGPRHKGTTLFPISEWPLYVYVIRILDEAAVRSLVLTQDQIQIIAWGEIYRTRKEAEAEVKKARKMYRSSSGGG